EPQRGGIDACRACRAFRYVTPSAVYILATSSPKNLPRSSRCPKSINPHAHEPGDHKPTIERCLDTGIHCTRRNQSQGAVCLGQTKGTHHARTQSASPEKHRNPPRLPPGHH